MKAPGLQPRRRDFWLKAVPSILRVLLAATSAAGASSGPEEVPRTLTFVRAALEDGLPDVAERELERLLTPETRAGLTPDQADEILLLLARTLYEQRRYADLLRRLEARDPWVAERERRVPLAYWRALAFYETRQTEAALRALQGIEERYRDPETLQRALRLRALAQVQAGDLAAALTTFAEWDRRYATTPESTLNLLDWGRTLFSTGRFEEAHGLFRRAEESAADASSRLESRYWRGCALANLGRPSDAATLWSDVAASPAASPDLRAQTWMALASAVTATGGTAEVAAAFLLQALAAARTDALRHESALRAGRLLLETDRWEEGVRLIKREIEAAPNDPASARLQLEMAGTLLRRGHASEAAEEYRRYLEAYGGEDGQMMEAYEGRGWSLLESGRPVEAAAAFAQAAQRAAAALDRERCCIKVGDAQFAAGQYRSALETYRRVAQEFPASSRLPDVLYQTALCHDHLDEPETAEALWCDLVDRFPHHPLAEEALFHIARAREVQQRWREAEEFYGRLIATWPQGVRVAEALTRRGLIRHRSFRFEEALQDFERVVREFPNQDATEQAFLMRAMCQYGLWRDEQAAAVCREFLQRFPESRWVPDAMFWLAGYAYNQGQYAEAERQFLALGDRFPSDPRADAALLQAGRAAQKSGEYRRAIDLLTRLVRQYPASSRLAEARFAQAECLAEVGEYGAAIALLDALLTSHSASEWVGAAWLRKGDCQFTLGAEDPKWYEDSLLSYRHATMIPEASPDLVLQAEYKIGRSLEKLGRTVEAFDQYYVRVVLRYLEYRQQGTWLPDDAQVWFTRAGFNAADLAEASGDWRRAVSLLERVAGSDVPASLAAAERANRIKTEHQRRFRWPVAP